MPRRIKLEKGTFSLCTKGTFSFGANTKSTVLTIDDEAVIVAFRKHTLLPLDDCQRWLGESEHPG
jgi:hypothetical protein